MKRMLVFSYAFAMLTLLATPGSAADTPPDITFATAVSKESKLSTELAELTRIDGKHGVAAAQVFAADRDIDLSDATLTVVIRTRPEHIPLVRTEIERVGGTFVRSGSDLVLARMPLAALDTLAEVSEVLTIRRPEAPVPFQVTSQGVQRIGASAIHQQGFRGEGVKVAVLDVGFQGYQTSILEGELPSIPAGHVKSFSGDITGSGEKHGTAVAEIIHDVAPGADMYLVNASNEVELESAVDWLIEQRVQVINASWGYPCGGSVDGTGRIQGLIKRAADAGIVWVNAAGNFALRHWSAAFNDAEADGWHNFAASENANTVFLRSGEKIRACVVWDDWTSKNQDYDLYAWNGNGSIVASSKDGQNGPNSHDPTESLSFTASSDGYYFIGIKNYRTTRSSTMHLYVYPPGEECAVESTASVETRSDGTLTDLRAFRDEVLTASPVGRAVTSFYYRHSREAVRILFRHPQLALEAAALVRLSRPAVTSILKSRRGDFSERAYAIPVELVARTNAFLDQLSAFGSPVLRDDLTALRMQLDFSAAANEPAVDYFDATFGGAVAAAAISRPVVPTVGYPESGFMRHTTTAMSVIPPADSPYALAVGATNWSDDLPEDFSSLGPTADGRLKPDIAAPDRVCTATYGDCSGEGFAGTSAAAAHVSGAVALVRQMKPAATLEELRAFLRERAVDIPPVGSDTKTGVGRLALAGPTLLPPPTLIVPEGAGQSTWPTFAWSHVDGASYYRLLVSTTETMPTDPNAADCSDCVINTTLSRTHVMPADNLRAFTTYFWQVQANSAAVRGAWSRKASFKTQMLPEMIAPDRQDLLEENNQWPAPAGNATVITHGWMLPLISPPQWPKQMADAICGRFKSSAAASARPNTFTKVCQGNVNGETWDVWVLDWHKQAEAVFPVSAFNDAVTVGEQLATTLNAKHYARVHLIAHSAGSNLIQSATARMKNRLPGPLNTTPEVHETFLDAYDPLSDASKYGRYADWSDNYVDTRELIDLVGLDLLDGTKLFLHHAYSIDVTPNDALDPCSADSFTSVCRHGRPYRFYGFSIDRAFGGLTSTDSITTTGGMGYALSFENGKPLRELATAYGAGGACAMVGAKCSVIALPADVRYIASVHTPRVVESVGGNVSFPPGDSYRSITLGPPVLMNSDPAADQVSSSATATDSPSWAVLNVTTTDSVSMMRFSWKFASAGEGLLRIYVDGLLVRELDQRNVSNVSSETEEVYVGGVTGTLPPGVHRVVFRLDGFSTKSASAVQLTDIDFARVTTQAKSRAVRH